MEYHILNNYLKYQKEHSPSLMKELKKVPLHMLIITGLAILCAIVGSIFAFTENLKHIFWLFVLLEVVFAYILFISLDKWTIKHSDIELLDFKTYHKELYEWLKSISISSKEHIEILINRFNDILDGQIKEKEKRSDKIDKWMQTMIIPVVLAIITGIISAQKDIEEILVYTFSLIALIIMIYGVIWIIRSIIGIFQKKGQNNIEYFLCDLEAILDVMFIFNNEDEESLNDELNITEESDNAAIKSNQNI